MESCPTQALHVKYIWRDSSAIVQLRRGMCQALAVSSYTLSCAQKLTSMPSMPGTPGGPGGPGGPCGPGGPLWQGIKEHLDSRREPGKNVTDRGKEEVGCQHPRERPVRLKPMKARIQAICLKALYNWNGTTQVFLWLGLLKTSELICCFL